MKRAVILALALPVIAAGCGGGASGAAETSAAEPSPWAPAQQFLIPGGDNLAAEFGREAPAPEREQVSRLIHRWMRVRVAQAWAKDCGYLSQRYKKAIAADASSVTHGRATTCPTALAYFGPNASGKLVNTLNGPIGSLRVEDGKAFALYHGNDGSEWNIPLVREGGHWWIDKAEPLVRE